MKLATRLALLAVLLAPARVFATPFLVNWCVNHNGSVGPGNQQPVNSCNGGVLPADPSVNIAAFDTTLRPAPNTLGSITVTFGTGSQYIAVYMNYDVDFGVFGSFDDNGFVIGVPTAGVSYELDDPNTSSIFNNFAAGALTNVNNTVSCGGPSSVALLAVSGCDVSWALAQSLLVDPSLFSGGSITFTVSGTPPASGFYLQQRNADSGSSIYLSESFRLTPLAPTAVPEPQTLMLLLTGLPALALRRRRR
jgi:hypothetical protein